MDAWRVGCPEEFSCDQDDLRREDQEVGDPGPPRVDDDVLIDGFGVHSVLLCGDVPEADFGNMVVVIWWLR